MQKDEALLIAVENWHKTNWLRLAGEGITMTLRPRTTEFKKNSVSIVFDTEDQLVEAVFWDSGESDVMSAGKRDSQDPTVTTHFVPSVGDVTALLELLQDELSCATQ